MQHAKIEQWTVVRLGGVHVLHGRVKEHPRQHRFDPTQMQYTSELRSIDFGLKQAQTLNTIYDLE